MLKKGYQRNLAAIALLSLNNLTDLIISLVGEGYRSEFAVLNFLRLGIVISLAVLVLFQAFKKKPRSIKRALLISIYLNLALEVVYFLISHIRKEFHQREKHILNTMLNQILTGQFLNVIGIFYFKEHLCFNIINFTIVSVQLLFFSYQSNLHLIHITAVTAIFNLCDARSHGKHELEAFNNLIKIEKKSLYLSQFVERLLPKHVG